MDGWCGRVEIHPGGGGVDVGRREGDKSRLRVRAVGGKGMSDHEEKPRRVVIEGVMFWTTPLFIIIGLLIGMSINIARIADALEALAK